MDRRLHSAVLAQLVAAFREGATSVTSTQVQAALVAAGEDLPAGALDAIFEDLLNHRLVRGPGLLNSEPTDESGWVITGVAPSLL